MLTVELHLFRLGSKSMSTFGGPVTEATRFVVVDEKHHQFTLVHYQIEDPNRDYYRGDRREDPWDSMSFDIITRNQTTHQYSRRTQIQVSKFPAITDRLRSLTFTSREFHQHNLLLTGDLLVCRLPTLNDQNPGSILLAIDLSTPEGKLLGHHYQETHPKKEVYSVLVCKRSRGVESLVYCIDISVMPFESSITVWKDQVFQVVGKPSKIRCVPRTLTATHVEDLEREEIRPLRMDDRRRRGYRDRGYDDRREGGYDRRERYYERRGRPDRRDHRYRRYDRRDDRYRGDRPPRYRRRDIEDEPVPAKVARPQYPTNLELRTVRQSGHTELVLLTKETVCKSKFVAKPTERLALYSLSLKHLKL